MYAVVSSGGKQYRVEPGAELVVERVAGEAGSTITFDRVLLVGDGEAVTVGTPTVEGATVSGTVLGEALGPKLIVFKFKQKATYRRKRGHRQHLTRVRIDEITAGGRSGKAARAEAKAASTEATASAPAQAEAGEAEASAPAPKRTRKSAAADEAKPKATEAAAASEATEGEAAKPKTTRRRTAAKQAQQTDAAEE